MFHESVWLIITAESCLTVVHRENDTGTVHVFVRPRAIRDVLGYSAVFTEKSFRVKTVQKRR